VFRSVRSRRDLDDNIQFIGVTVDAKLTWTYHIKSVKSKVAKGIGVLAKARKYVDTASLKLLYNSIIYSNLNYCVEVWGNSANIYINPLFKLQKKAVKRRSHTAYDGLGRHYDALTPAVAASCCDGYDALNFGQNLYHSIRRPQPSQPR